MKNYTFIRPDPELQNNLMAFGFECGKGWYPLIIELFDKIQEIVDNNPEYADLEVLQVKEKWGWLTIYWNYYWEEIENLTDEYQEKSLHICERCGGEENVSMRNHHGWYVTLCQNCENNPL